jgi:hypothetical protein
MDVLAHFAKLDQTDRRALRRFWTRIGALGEIDRVTDEIVEAAFGALDHFNHESPEEEFADRGGGSWGACVMIRRAIEERPAQRDAILGRLIQYYRCSNIQVAVAAVRALERSETCQALAAPYLRQIAAAEETIRSVEGLALRGFAWIMLYRIDATIEGDTSYRAAQLDAAYILRHWHAGSAANEESAKAIELARRLEAMRDQT